MAAGKSKRRRAGKKPDARRKVNARSMNLG
jgi:hypothetical protein